MPFIGSILRENAPKPHSRRDNPRPVVEDCEGLLAREERRLSTKLTPPADGAKITISNGKLTVPDNPIIPFIEGDGIGPDVWRASQRVMDAAVAKAYGGKQIGRAHV